MKKKFAVKLGSPEQKTSDNVTQICTEPNGALVRLPENESRLRFANFSPYYGKGFDDITESCQRALQKLINESIRTKGQSLSIMTIVVYYNLGFRSLAPFLELLSSASGGELTMADLTPELISKYVQYLKDLSVKYSSQRNYFKNTKSLLVACHKFRLWPEVEIKTVFPRNPFPNSNRRSMGYRGLSKNEKRQVIRGLRLEMQRIVEGTGPLNSYDLSICVLSIALSTGMNPAPIMELLTDCIQLHPLKSNLRLLVSFKRRGKNTQAVALRKSQEVSEIASVHLYAADAIELVVERNEEVRAEFSHPQLLFVHRNGKYNDNLGKATRLTSGVMLNYAAIFAARHEMVDDDGKPLILNVSRLRKTMLNRVWELSGQDPLMAARTGRHSLETGNAHYWEAPPEAEANMRFIGEARVKSLLENTSIISTDRTPVASCKDNKYGRRAPKNGTVCQDYLGCFRCKSFVVTGEDLHRLFSFYWAAIRDHDNFGGKRWRTYFRQVIRLIDEEIAPQFDPALVEIQRKNAKENPHPFWRDLTMARMAI